MYAASGSARCSSFRRTGAHLAVARFRGWRTATAAKSFVSAKASAANKIDLETLSVLTRAIHQKSALEISYRALSSGLTTREIVPFALADNGQRWHVRAFDRRSGEFRDFRSGPDRRCPNLTGNVASTKPQTKTFSGTGSLSSNWFPHPANVQHPDTIEAEYGMENGVLNLRVRAAMAGYLMRRWNVDCTEDHSLKGAEFHLWLRNRQALYGVTNLMLAPGYEPSEKAVAMLKLEDIKKNAAISGIRAWARCSRRHYGARRRQRPHRLLQDTGRQAAGAHALPHRRGQNCRWPRPVALGHSTRPARNSSSPPKPIGSIWRICSTR
jgi:hypothetical protein